MCKSFGAWVPLLAGGLLLAATPALAQPDLAELKRLSIEDLIDIDVTISRQPGSTIDTPSAIAIVTRDDIRRSGSTSVPEALRLAPGVHVARIDAARFAIGIRGFSDRLARSMLVLIDGRAVYSPLFAGTYWETQFPMLEDIDRIEVVRGPGGTLFGTNAVNGIVNIVTRPVRETQGIRVNGRIGNYLRGPVGVSLGDALAENVYVRAYVQAVARDAFSAASDDDLRMAQGGFRADWDMDEVRQLTIQGDLYRARIDQAYRLPLDAPPFVDAGVRESPLSGANLLARWQFTPASGTSVRIQTYYDRTHRDEVPIGETRDTFDFDVQMNRVVATRHRLAWGAGYRFSNGRIRAVPPAGFTPSDRSDSLVTAFVEDAVVLVPGRLDGTIGLKLEHNDYSGAEVQPSARVLFKIDPLHAIMGSVARAVRTPSRVETDYTVAALADPNVPSFVRLLPNPDFVSEQHTVWELGYRGRPHAALYVTAAGFYNQLEDILSTELTQAFVEAGPPSRLILPVMFRNGLFGNSYGGELTVDWRPRTWWRSTADYSYVRIQLTPREGSNDVSQEERNERLTPRHQMTLHSALDLPGGLQLDWILRYVSEARTGNLPGYTTSDIRLSWLVTPSLELAVVGQDLHQKTHREWSESTVPVPRRAFVSLTWRDY